MTSFLPVLKPMLALTSDPFDSHDFLFEPKWDGFRCLAYLERDSTLLKSRNGSDLTGCFPELTFLHNHVVGTPAILDGEIIAFQGGRESFYLLLQRLRSPSPKAPVGGSTPLVPAIFIAFDILYSRGESVLTLPLEERKELLERVVVKGGSEHLLVNSYILQAGKALFEAAVAQGREGIMAKKLDSPYLPGKRTKLWLKIKPDKTVEAVVVGFIPKTDKTFASLVLGQYSPDGQLVHVGNVGTGFTERTMEELLVELKPLVAWEKPLVQDLPPGTQNVIWVKPQMVVEVNYLEYTPAGTLRHPVYRRRRQDLMPEQCIFADHSEKGDG
jgi:DNA ligase-1